MSRTKRDVESSFMVILGVLLVLAIVRAFGDCVWEDARVYLRAGSRFLEGVAMYRASDGTMPFKYAPQVALVFAPYSLLPLAAGCIAWNLTNLLVFASAGRAWIEWLGIERPADLWLATLSLGTAFYLELHFGQSDLLLFALATGSLAAALSGRPLRAGLFFTLMVLFKPPMLVMVVPLVLYGKRRHLIALAGVTALVAMTLGVVLRYGVAGALEQFAQWRDVLAATSPPWVLFYNSQSLVAVIIEVFRFPTPTTMADTVVPQLIAIAVVAPVLVRLRASRFKLVAGCLLASALLSPLAWRANFVLAWPALLALWAGRRTGVTVVLGAALAAQIILADGVLPLEATRAVLMWRPFGWFGAAALMLLALPQVPRLPELAADSQPMNGR
jgi:hypothetical protein